MSKNWDNKILPLARQFAPPRMDQNPADNPDQMLWETVQRLHAIVEASPLAIVALDAAGGVQKVKRGAARNLGWSREPVIGRALPTVPAG